MLGGADNPNGELPSYITGADTGSKITTECPSESFVGSRKHNGLSTSAKVMSMNASVRSNSFVVNSGK